MRGHNLMILWYHIFHTDDCFLIPIILKAFFSWEKRKFTLLQSISPSVKKSVPWHFTFLGSCSMWHRDASTCTGCLCFTRKIQVPYLRLDWPGGGRSEKKIRPSAKSNRLHFDRQACALTSTPQRRSLLRSTVERFRKKNWQSLYNVGNAEFVYILRL